MSAHNGLGVLHFEGAGNAKVDYAAAREAFTRGAELGEPDAMFNLATLYSGKQKNQLKQDLGMYKFSTSLVV